ncbi:hypothetical protein TNCV_3671461 [Trichonephila clavipes]|nr:hypothetical protein TNCV_3671461 [Trichonephila clavipes]
MIYPRLKKLAVSGEKAKLHKKLDADSTVFRQNTVAVRESPVHTLLQHSQQCGDTGKQKSLIRNQVDNEGFELANMVANDTKMVANDAKMVANVVTKNDANLALPPRFRQVLIESSL